MSILKLSNGINIPIRSIAKYKRLNNGLTVLFLTDGTTLEVNNLPETKIVDLLNQATSLQSDADTIQRRVELAVTEQQKVIENSLQQSIATNKAIHTALGSFSEAILSLTKTVYALQQDFEMSKEKHRKLTLSVDTQNRELTSVVSDLGIITNKLKEFVGA